MVIRLTSSESSSSSSSSSNRRYNSTRPVILLIVLSVFLLFHLNTSNRFITSIVTSNNNAIIYTTYLSAGSAAVTNAAAVAAVAIYSNNDNTTTVAMSAAAAAVGILEEDNDDKKHSVGDQLLDWLDNFTNDGPPATRNRTNCPSPLIYFENVIVRSRSTSSSSSLPETVTTTTTTSTTTTKNDTTTTTTTQLIPKILHVSHKSRCLPQDLARRMEMWKQKLPNYSIFFHDDTAVNKLIYHKEGWWSEFPNLHRAMKCVLFKGAMKIDVWRILLIYRFGGVYTDIDVQPLAGFTDETIIRNDLSAFFFNDPWNRPSQWFIAAEPRHPIMNYTALLIIENLFKLDNIQFPKLIHVTGPHVMKSGWTRFIQAGYTDASADTYNSSGYPDLFKNNFIFTGQSNKKVIKLDRKKIISQNPAETDMSDIVTYQSKNMTRMERVRLQSSVRHWKDYTGRGKIPSKTSCQKYLKMIDEGELDEIDLI